MEEATLLTLADPHPAGKPREKRIFRAFSIGFLS